MRRIQQRKETRHELVFLDAVGRRGRDRADAQERRAGQRERGRAHGDPCHIGGGRDGRGWQRKGTSCCFGIQINPTIGHEQMTDEALVFENLTDVKIF